MQDSFENEDDDWGKVYNCSQCGREIYACCYDMGKYVYRLTMKHKRYIFCSWGCQRKFESEHEKELGKPRLYTKEKKQYLSSRYCG